MNDTAIRESARERLLDAELCEVLDAAVPGATAPPDPAPARRWLGRAALVTLGVAVAISAFALRQPGPARVAQDPQPQDEAPPGPWTTPWERWREALHACPTVDSAADLAALATGTHGLRIDGETAADSVFREALRRDGITTVVVRGPASSIPWDHFGPEVSVRAVSFLHADPKPEQLRRLRLLPELRALYLASREFGAAHARALAELPKLTTLMIGGVPHRNEMAALRASTTLRHLAFEILPAGLASPLSELAGLDQLESLSLSGAGSKLTKSMARELGAIAGLRNLDLQFVDSVEPGAAAALPADLTSISVRPRAFQADDIESLTRLRALRHLRLGGSVPETRSAWTRAIEALPLARIELPHTSPDRALWQALATKPTLRRLTISTPRELLRGQLEECAAVRTIAGLDVYLRRLPDAKALHPLRGLPELREVRIRIDVGNPTVKAPTNAEVRAFLDAASAALGDNVAVTFASF